MGVQVENPKKVLSKNQIQKIKTAVGRYLKDHEGALDGLHTFLNKEVLASVRLAEENLYNRVSYREDAVSGHVIVTFGYQSKEDLSRRLKDRLRVHTSCRASSENGNAELWKRYATFKKYARANIRVPTPTEVRKERTMFEQVLEAMPNSDFKRYLQDCM